MKAILLLLLVPNLVTAQVVSRVTADVDVVRRWDINSGLWAECIVRARAENEVLIVEMTVPAELHHTPRGIAPICPDDSIGFVQPDQSGECELKPEEMRAFEASKEIVRLVYCGGGMSHYYLQPRKYRLKGTLA